MGYPSGGIEMSSFTAAGYEDHVGIEWTTASEIDPAGFNLYRVTGSAGRGVRINDQLIHARINPIDGTSYSFNDGNAAEGVS